MRRRSLQLIILAGAGILLAACSSGDSGPASKDAGSSAPQQRFLSIGTAPPGGAFFVVGGALGEVLDNHGPAGWEVTAEATKGSQENIRRLASGELDIALSNAAISYFAVRGSDGWEEAYPISTIMTLAPNVALFLTPADSGVARMADLKGNRVVVGPAGAGFEYFLRPLLGAHGLTYEDFSPLNNTQAGAVDMLADGSAAAAFLGGAVPTASNADLPGRYPYESGWKCGSTSGSKYNFATICAMRSATVGIPKGRTPLPWSFGISTNRTGGGK